MDCRILRQLTLKADGHLSCDDSNGYYIHVGDVSRASGWSIKQVLAGAIYQHIRRSFREGRVPWPGICETCDCFSPGGESHDTLDSRVRIMVEPTLACELACPSCKRRQELSRRHSSSELEPEMLGRLIRSCMASKITVDQVHYLGWGEPLLHSRFPELIDTVSSISSATSQEVTTTGNADFRSSIGSAPIDRIVVSCDGVNQNAYEKYRINGNFQQAIAFMRDAKKYGHSRLYLEWKYILFAHNDSDDELLEAQSLAEDIGVDSLLFIITNSKRASTRYRLNNIADLPRRSRVASVSPAAAMLTTDDRPMTVDRSSTGDKPLASLYVDSFRLTTSGVLLIEGWALASDGRYVSHIEVHDDGESILQVPTVHRRSDVLESRTAEGPTAVFSAAFRFQVRV